MPLQPQAFETGAVLEVPLGKLKLSPRNARKMPHRAVDIEALAASIAAKGLLQPLVVEPERDGESQETGDYLVTIGEGRRQALLLMASRKQLRKTTAIRCILDTTHDPFEISLDENVTRFAMHPADQFEAFQKLSLEHGFGPEEIAARFGVTATVVRQRMRLAAVSPRLLALYREDGMTLDQLMAFAATEDHKRQEEVWEALSWNRDPALIRRLLAEGKVRASDKRALFVGHEAYSAAGGVIERDLFQDDHGGYFTSPALLDRLALAKHAALGETLMADGWKWVEAAIDRPPVHHLRRIYPRTCDLSDDDQARIHALSSEYDALMDGRDPEEPLDEALGAALDLIAEELKTLEAKRRAYDAGDLARAGVFVVLGHDGAPCIEAGFVRAEDELVVEVGQNEDGLADPPHGAVRQTEDQNVSLLSEKLVGDLSAHFTAALIDQLGQTPHIALAALVYTLVLSAFRDVGGSSCLSISLHQARLDAHADGIRDSMACRAVEARHALWAAELPTDGDGLWPAILAMSDDRLVALLAHCVSLSANAVTATENRLSDHAVDLAKALDLNMAGYWTPTVANYLGRVTKPRILEAVSEGVTVEAAERIKGLQKQAMAEAAEGLLDGKRWLPAILRRHAPEGLPMDLAAE